MFRTGRSRYGCLPSLRAPVIADGGRLWDYGALTVPSFVTDRINSELDPLNFRNGAGQSYNLGLARLHKKGAPSFTVDYSHTQGSGDGSGTTKGRFYIAYGRGTLNGVRFTKYLNA